MMTLAEFLNDLKGVGTAIRWRTDKLGEGGLYVQEFTAFLGVSGNVGELRDLLEKENAKNQEYAVRGLQALRWVLFQPTGDAEVPAPEQQPPHALVLSITFDGEIDDVLDALLERVDLVPILRFCRAYARGTPIAAYLKKHRVRSGFLFRDLGPLRDPVPGGYVVDATRAEIQEAVDLEDAFERFYDTDSNPVGRAERFLREFGARTVLLAVTRFERRQPDEERWIRRVSELSRTRQARAARNADGNKRGRGAHAKGHGLLAGTLRVIKAADPSCQRGLFANPDEKFDIAVRLSNGSPDVHADGARDARGFAMRVAVPREPDEFLLFTGGAGIQDFVLFSDPVFFAADIRQFATIYGILTTSSKLLAGLRAIAFFIKGGFAPLWLVWRILFRRAINHPLAVEFHSATPYQLGEDLVVKYSIVARNRDSLSERPRAPGDDFLTAALEGDARTPSLKLDFFVHVLPIREQGLPDEAVRDIVEDATLDWKKLGARRVKVAELELQPANPDDRSDLAAAEAMKFDPWNSLAVHRPLGSLNRARYAAYRESVQFRSAGAAAGPRVASGPRPPAPPPNDSSSSQEEAAE